jgi:hypothetical protein
VNGRYYAGRKQCRPRILALGSVPSLAFQASGRPHP